MRVWMESDRRCQDHGMKFGAARDLRKGHQRGPFQSLAPEQLALERTLVTLAPPYAWIGVGT